MHAKVAPFIYESKLFCLFFFIRASSSTRHTHKKGKGLQQSGKVPNSFFVENTPHNHTHKPLFHLPLDVHWQQQGKKRQLVYNYRSNITRVLAMFLFRHQQSSKLDGPTFLITAHLPHLCTYIYLQGAHTAWTTLMKKRTSCRKAYSRVQTQERK